MDDEDWGYPYDETETPMFLVGGLNPLKNISH